MKKLNAMMVLLLSSLLVACGGHEFNLALDEDSFTQKNTISSAPIDILWVIDNSGSMETSQNQVANNISSFIAKFKNTNFDFRIAVTTTSAYKAMAPFNLGSSFSRFVDGTDDTSHTGIFVMDRDTPNLEDVFKINVKQGILGSSDERGFQSMQAALSNAQNLVDFPRAGSFLAVIFMTDEEDFSWNGTANIQLLPDGVTPNSITDNRLLPVSGFLSFLDGLTNSTADKRNYSVNTIAIFDQACLTELSTSFSGRRFAQRYADMTDATGGVKASLCDDFSGILSNITDSILSFTTKFTLNRAADPETLQIYVNDALVPTSGYTYNVADNTVTFHGDYIPGNSSAIRVKFQPTAVKE